MKHHDSRGWLFVAPACLLLGVVGLIPLVTVINYSFFEIFTLQSRFWIGTEWFRDLITAPRFWASFGRSALFSTFVLCIQIPLGVALALCIPRGRIWAGAALAVLSLPLLVPWNMIPALWLSLMDGDTGILGQWLAGYGWPAAWKDSAVLTWLVILAMDTWHWTSLVVILAYSALTTIPDPLYQAAAIDGARPWQVFRHIQLPRLQHGGAAAVHGQFHDLHGGLSDQCRRPGRGQPVPRRGSGRRDQGVQLRPLGRAVGAIFPDRAVGCMGLYQGAGEA